MKIYVGNLPNETTEEQLQEVFSAFGEVSEVNILRDRDTGESRGFGFVEMRSAEEAKAAIEALDASDAIGQPLKVQESTPKAPRGGGRGFGGGGGGGGRGRGRGGRGRGRRY